MARNGSGTYSVPNSFTASTTIESAKVNQNFTDMGSEITGSLPRNGEAAMTGQLKSSSGTAAAPGITFSSELTSGFYRVSAGVIGAAVLGSQVAKMDSTGWQNASGENYDAFPAGTSMLFYNAAAPTGWTGSDAASDHALRVVTTASGNGGSTGGSTAFTDVFTARTITKSHLPASGLTYSGTTSSSGSHSHSVFLNLNTNESGSSNHATTGSGGTFTTDATAGGTTTNGAHTHTFSGTTSNMGSGDTIDFAVQYLSVIRATKD